MLEKFMSLQTVAELLSVNDETVRRWIEAGDLPAVKFGQSWRISESDYRAWIASKRRLDDRLVEKN